MRAVAHVDQGVVEVNYMWLPTWIGLNSNLLTEIGKHMQDKAVGKELNDDTLNELHDAVVDFLCEKHPGIDGLKDHLDGLLKVSLPEYDAAEHQG